MTAAPERARRGGRRPRPARRPAGAALLAAARPAVIAAGGQHLVLQRRDVPGVADDHPGVVRLAAVPGQHRPGRGHHVQRRRAEPVPDRDLLPGMPGRHGVEVAVPGRQRLRRHDPPVLDDRGERHPRQRRQRLGRGQLADGGPRAVADPAAGIPVPGAPASSRACARAGEASSGSVRHHRCAAEWLAFSTTPLRQPRRDGHTSTATA